MGTWASPTTEAGLPTCSGPRTGTSARCSTSSSRSRSRQRNLPGIPLGCFAVVLSAGNQSLYIWEPALGGYQPFIVTDLNISGYGYICTGIYVAIFISMCFLKLQLEVHCYQQDICFSFLRLTGVAINLEFPPL